MPLWSRIRAFEQAGLEAQKQGLVLGAIHPSIGQEAVAAGVCSHLRQSDVLLSTHRGHGHTLAKGADGTAMMCELFGRAGGTCQGKGGSMHIADFSVGMLGANGVVAANIPIATGAAHAIKLRREDRIVVCLFGDGAINRGPVPGGPQLGQDLRAADPVRVRGQRLRRHHPNGGIDRRTEGPVARAESLGIPAAEVDGNDVLAIDELAADRIDRLRRGEGPQFVLARTYRLAGHTAADPGAYRSADEVAARWRHDPLTLCREMLLNAGVGEAEIDLRDREASEEMDRAMATARAAPWPDPALAFTDVQDIGTPARGHHG